MLLSLYHFSNLSQGSATDLGFGSMEKEKRRKMKLDEGRRDPESVINELMEQADLDKATHEDAESELDTFGSRRCCG